MRDVLPPPMLEGEVADGESGHGIVLEDETLVSFVMPPEVNRSLPAQEGAIGNCVLTVTVRSENCHTGACHRGEQGDAVRAAAKVRGLENEGVGSSMAAMVVGLMKA
jgi:hypothetical protein